MSWTIWMATAVVIASIYALVKRYETRLVLLSAGFLMAILSMKPMMAFQQFDKSMTAATLIIAICSAIGFAGVVSITKCDVHLVSLLTKPLKRFGIFSSSRLLRRNRFSFHCDPINCRLLRCCGTYADSAYDSSRL